MSVEGLWKIAVATPLGTRHTMLELYTEDGALQAISRGENEQLVLRDLRLDGDQLSWYQEITKPMRMELAFEVVVTGDDMSGTAKGGPMRAAKVSGRRESAAKPA